MPADQLPEGTDTIIEGAGVGADDETDTDAADADAEETMARPDAPKAEAPRTDAPEEPVSFASRVDALKGQAGDRARDFVQDAKDRATGSIDDVVRMIQDAAGEVDDKVGAQYGDYVRRAADGVSGLSEALKNKDVDALFADARDVIKKSPGVAIGAAAAIGFVVARLARAGLPEGDTPSTKKAA